ncbi:MAG: hypothetical protein LBD37_10760 [Treponema sp.]|nr:hypothetical protein [Treponema sp.]
MKRHSRLFEQIVDYHNIRGAFLNAIRGNRESPGSSIFAGTPVKTSR